MDTNTNLEEFETLAKVMDDEVEAHLVNDELVARTINDEIDAHQMNSKFSEMSNEQLISAAEGLGFVATETSGGSIMLNAGTDDSKINDQIQAMQDRMAKYLASKAGHQPGKQFERAGTTYTVQAHPHEGVWVRDNPVIITNPNLKNKSVRNKLQRHPNKYTVVNS